MPSDAFLLAFDEHARQNPDRLALTFHDERISYGELDRLAARAGEQLAALALPAGRPLCVVAKKSPQAIALILACLRSGRQILLPSAELGEDVLGALARQTSCAAVVSAGPPVAGSAGPGAGEGPAAVTARPVPAGAADEPFRLPPTDQVRLFLTTSGSTGTPKIVPIAEAAVDAFSAWAAGQFEIRPGTTVLSYAPLNFDLALLDVWTTLRAGGCVALVDQDRATDAGYLRSLFAADGVQVVQSVPMLFRLLDDGRTTHDPLSERTRHVVSTGDTLPPGLVTRLAALFPAARFYNLFGCTETNDSLMHEIDSAAGEPGERVPVGRPLPGVDALLIDADGRIVTGPGSGELLVRTPFQTPGYLDPRRDEGVFVPHPDGTAPGAYYRTGDVVTRRADGIIVLDGRSDFHVKVRGVRTNMQEVEQVLLDHPEVREAAVVAVPDALAGVRLHALIRRQDGSGLTGLHLRSHCAARLPRTSIPSSLVVGDEPLPRTSTGKPDRNRIKQIHAAKG